MNKEFVTYEQALTLKELGYDDTPWFGNQASLYDVKGEHTMYTNYGVMYSGINDGYIFAPLKQQVFRWFREKYGLYQQIEVFRLSEFKDDELLFDFKIIDNLDDTDFYYDNDLYSTYEEAENACIDKLLELAKQQHHD